MIKSLEISQLKNLYDEHIIKDFENQSPPYKQYEKLLKDNVFSIFTYWEDVEKGYAVCYEKDNIIVLMYFAISAAHRKQGTGSNFLKELSNHFKDKKLLIAEVESLDNASNLEDRNFILKRIDFYNRNSFIMLPNLVENVNQHIYHIMVLPLGKNTSDHETEARKVLTYIYTNLFKGRIKTFEI